MANNEKTPLLKELRFDDRKGEDNPVSPMDQRGDDPDPRTPLVHPIPKHPIPRIVISHPDEAEQVPSMSQSLPLRPPSTASPHPVTPVPMIQHALTLENNIRNTHHNHRRRHQEEPENDFVRESEGESITLTPRPTKRRGRKKRTRLPRARRERGVEDADIDYSFSPIVSIEELDEAEQQHYLQHYQQQQHYIQQQEASERLSQQDEPDIEPPEPRKPTKELSSQVEPRSMDDQKILLTPQSQQTHKATALISEGEEDYDLKCFCANCINIAFFVLNYSRNHGK